MGKKTASQQPEQATPMVLTPPTCPRPRLKKLTIQNFRCIGSEPVEVELDDIVVLVGPNNVGKSSILRAYEVVMSHGSKEGELSIEDFPNADINSTRFPQIELETVVFDKTAPGNEWVDESSGEMVVKERWTWPTAGKPSKVGWDVGSGTWHASKGPWGAANVAQAYRPEPHRVEAFADPNEQANQITKLLTEALTAKIKDLKSRNELDGGKSNFQTLLESIKSIQISMVEDAKEEVKTIESEISNLLQDVFPGYEIKLDARPEDDIEKCISFFKASPQLRMGPVGGHQPTIDRQGSGARRTLLWAALKIHSEIQRTKRDTGGDRPHLLLIDEPELCLHPDAIRDACRVLYELPKAGNWQVMITTHSPIFIDLSRDNTSVVRVERKSDGSIFGTTVYRPSKAKLDTDDKMFLKVMNLYDPYVAEFFFGGRVIIVEGDTEYSAFKHIMSENFSKFRDIHIIRARGKAPIVTLCKILNQFGKGYAVLHDSDKEILISKTDHKERINPAWTMNKKILDAVNASPLKNSIRLVASVPNFEEAYLNEAAGSEKPYSAISKMKVNEQAYNNVLALLDSLLDHSKSLPSGAIEWSSLLELQAALV